MTVNFLFKCVTLEKNKLNVSFVFITQYYFAVPKNVRQNSTHYPKQKRTSNCEQIVFNHQLDTDFQDFMDFYKKCTENPDSFLVIDTTLSSDNCLRSRKNHLKNI